MKYISVRTSKSGLKYRTIVNTCNLAKSKVTCLQIGNHKPYSLRGVKNAARSIRMYPNKIRQVLFSSQIYK